MCSVFTDSLIQSGIQLTSWVAADFQSTDGRMGKTVCHRDVLGQAKLSAQLATTIARLSCVRLR